jgi:hypothetical protein
MRLGLGIGVTGVNGAPAPHEGLAFDFLQVRFHVRSAGGAAAMGTNALDFMSWTSSAKWTRTASGLFALTAANQPAYEWDEGGAALGARIENQRSNACLWSNDLTNAVWAKSSMTAAKTATGPDGAANSASTLTATAANATALQSFTSAAATRQFGAYVKRRTGSGVVDMTVDGGATWTPIAVTGAWTLQSMNQLAVTNPQVGFRLQSAGDEIDAMWCQLENGAAFTSSPIPTTTALIVRAADAATRTLGAETSNAAFTALWQGKAINAEAASGAVYPWSVDAGATSNNAISTDRGGASAGARVQVFVGAVAQPISSISPGLSAGQVGKHVYARSAADGSYHRMNAGTAVTQSAGLSMPANPFTRLSFIVTGNNHWLQRFELWPTRLSNADCAALTA